MLLCVLFIEMYPYRPGKIMKSVAVISRFQRRNTEDAVHVTQFAPGIFRQGIVPSQKHKADSNTISFTPRDVYISTVINETNRNI